MSAPEIKQELQNYIEIGDKQFIDKLYQTAKSYMEQKRLDRMIAEGEEDIKAGRLHSQEEVKKMIKGWTK
ncbi:hypothetical protein [Flavobacteriaceae bacterium 14752]|uniref:hypothetical protein n=1 Tax=Mesohalobacter salilacus TaxID=2491711 RepID=UPI000F642C9B|nr:hypothetical protein EIG84_02370 [Flavobacteriaceae bacterium 14752]